MLHDRVMAEKLARQAPYDDPRCTGLTYHPMTYGWLCGELLRRIDGRSLGRFFAEEIATPLGLEIWFGLPEAEEPRVTTIGGDGVWGLVSKNVRVPTPAQVAADPVHATIWYNPPLFGPDFSKWNSRACHAAEIPGAGAIGTARSIARLYAEIASGGGALMRPATIRLCTQQLADGWDGVNDERRRYAAGVSLQIEIMKFGPPADGFGHGGAGGSVHGAWPSHGIGFSYAMNRLIDGVDGRGDRLLAALHAALPETTR
jgi:CubicO group peptidase (beta-lactamase class C family)